MRMKTLMAAVAVAALGCATGRLSAQVAPAARAGGPPIAIGFGMSGYYLDYGPDRWMEGPVVRASVGIFHGFGVDVNARSIFMNTPAPLTRMQQNTFLAGAYFDGIHFGRVRPFARAAGGLGTIEFPSRNPAYTRDSYTVYAPSGGFEYQLSRKVALRAEYEYQFWKDFHGPRYLNPQGVTLGVTYYLRPRHTRERRD
jgi:hypothetical protein